jgi:hypothetical protein
LLCELLILGDAGSAEAKEAKDVWSKDEVLSEILPEIDSVFFGAFQVVDKKLQDSSRSSGGEVATEAESYIDFAFGSSETSFSGVHRLSVARDLDKACAQGVESDEIRLTMACVTCNPLKNRKVAPTWTWTFHRVYAMLLFREGVAEVVK